MVQEAKCISRRQCFSRATCWDGNKTLRIDARGNDSIVVVNKTMCFLKFDPLICELMD